MYGKATLPEPERPTRFRWVVCGLLFVATTINYIDRQVISILKPDLQRELGWSEIDYSNIIFAFSFAYAIISKKTLKDYWEKHPAVKAALENHDDIEMDKDTDQDSSRDIIMEETLRVLGDYVNLSRDVGKPNLTAGGQVSATH